jgi:predicted ATPase
VIHLRSIDIRTADRTSEGFPFDIPLIRHFRRIDFTSPVTFLVGENGSGKSTLLEAIAVGIDAVAVGGEDLQRDQTLAHLKMLAKQLKFVWHKKKTHRGFFLRAEDFFNFARRMHAKVLELDEIAKEFESELTGYGLSLAKGVVLGQRRAIVDKYGENLDANSHGESFLRLFQERFVPGGLYLLDEPEAPLSPQRQLSFLSIVKEMVRQDAQFIIATHSPIIMAFPDAIILSFDSYPLKSVAYDEVEHVSLTRTFLSNPERYLRSL